MFGQKLRILFLNLAGKNLAQVQVQSVIRPPKANRLVNSWRYQIRNRFGQFKVGAAVSAPLAQVQGETKIYHMRKIRQISGRDLRGVFL